MQLYTPSDNDQINSNGWPIDNIFYAHLKLIIPEQYKYAGIAIRQDKNSTWISLSADSHKMWKSDNRSVAS